MTQTYVAMVRGINLGGHKRISMPDLRAVFGALGADGVTTYVQSGNVVFTAELGDPSSFQHAVEARIERDLGVTASVLLRTGKALAKVARANPFVREGKAPELLHVTFLAEVPDRARIRGLDPPAGPDELRVVGQEVYLFCPSGYGRTKLDNAFFEKRLRVVATTRNWRTVMSLVGLAGQVGKAP